jgi:hypothetical protein
MMGVSTPQPKLGHNLSDSFWLAAPMKLEARGKEIIINYLISLNVNDFVSPSLTSQDCGQAEEHE